MSITDFHADNCPWRQDIKDGFDHQRMCDCHQYPAAGCVEDIIARFPDGLVLAHRASNNGQFNSFSSTEVKLRDVVQETVAKVRSAMVIHTLKRVVTKLCPFCAKEGQDSHDPQGSTLRKYTEKEPPRMSWFHVSSHLNRHNPCVAGKFIDLLLAELGLKLTTIGNTKAFLFHGSVPRPEDVPV